MATSLYDTGRNAFLNGAINWGTGSGGDTIRAALVNATNASAALKYVRQTTDAFWSDVIVNGTGCVISGTSGTSSSQALLSGKTTSAGVAGCNDVTFSSVGGTNIVDAVVIFKDTGTPATSQLIAYIDGVSVGGSATGLPVTPNTSNIVLHIDVTNKLFKL